MHRDSDRHKLFNRRAAMLASGKFALLSVLTGRLYYLQVVESEKYKNLANENRINFRLLPPPRGKISDRNGALIADNQQNYQLLLIPENTTSINATLDALENILPLSDADRKRILQDASSNKSFVPVTVRENLDWEQVSRIEVNTPDLPGILINVGENRHYPDGHDFAHVLGYVAAVSKKEKTDDPLLSLPGFRIGKAGVEKVHDLVLRGTGGNSQVEVNAYGRIIRELSRQEGQPGAEVQLTIDRDLQRLAVKQIADKSASVVVMDIHTGEVLALASSPGFDPNLFNRGLSGAEWQSLVDNSRAPLINKSIHGQYAPGSTFKMIVALAALEHGVISADTTHHCTGRMELGNAEFHCWKKHGHGHVTCTEAIMQSCDVYFYEVAKRLGITKISEMATRIGLGAPLGIDLPGERGGLVPTPEWKQETVGSSWQQGETIILGIGQGYILVTPLQLATVTACLVNGGLAVKPHVTRRVITDEGTTEPIVREAAQPVGITPEHLSLVVDSMAEAVNNPFGTAFQSRISDQGMSMGGKTGTVQVRRISKAEREAGVIRNEELEWKDRDHALFVGYGPVENPRYAISVVVEHGGSGSRVAAPIARDVMREAQRRKIGVVAGDETAKTEGGSHG